MFFDPRALATPATSATSATFSESQPEKSQESQKSRPTETPPQRPKVYRVRVRMDDGQPDRWVTMLGATDDDDARKSAHNTFTPERVLRIEEQL